MTPSPSRKMKHPIKPTKNYITGVMYDPTNIAIAEQVLLFQKPARNQPRYDPDPYTVTEVQGTQITTTRRG